MRKKPIHLDTKNPIKCKIICVLFLFTTLQFIDIYLFIFTSYDIIVIYFNIDFDYEKKSKTDNLN